MFLLHRLKITNFKQLTDVALTFPESGSVLIEGPNEAGKSSLFEAVYFALYGKSLISEQFYHIADLKQHGADSMQVELEFSIEGRRFTIRRKCGANQTVEFLCPTLEGIETLRGINSVSRRLQEELRFSAGALLNTCFVEQKCLENLEKLAPPDRKAAINELLNLRSLTRLEADFKVSHDDKRALQDADRRVEIARWDERLPILSAEREASQRAKNYVIWSALWQRGNEIAGAIDAAVAERKSGEASLAEVDQRLRIAQQLQETLRSVQTDLPLRIRPWAASLEAAEEAEQAVAQVEALAAQLPARRKLINIRTHWADQLEQLEDLERQDFLLAADLQSRQEAQAAYVRLTADWEQGEREKVGLEAAWERCRDARDTAQTDMNRRVQAKTENERRTLLLQHLNSQVTAMTESQALQEQIAARKSDTARLPVLEEREENLTRLENDLRRARDDQAGLAQVQENLRRCEDQIKDAKATQDRLDAIYAFSKDMDRLLAAARLSEADAECALGEVALAAALREWADAREQVAAVDPRARPEGDLPEQLRILQGQIDEETVRAASLIQRRLIASVISATGILAIIGGMLMHLPILLGVAGVVALSGVIWTAVSHRVAISATAELTKKREDQKGLEGEQRAMEAQSRANLQHSQQVQERETRAGEALQKRGVGVPASPEEARGHAERLSRLSMEDARRQRDLASSDVQRRHIELQGLQQDVARETQALTRQDLPSLQRNHEQFSVQEQRLKNALEAHDTIPAELTVLGLNNGEQSLIAALVETRRQIAIGNHAVQSLPTLEAELRSKNALVEMEREKAHQIAGGLGIEEADPEALKDCVEQVRRDFAQICIDVPENLLTTHLRQAQEALESADRECTILNARQAERRAKLDATNPNDLETATQESLNAVNANTDARQELTPVRTSLLREQLPDQSHTLRTAIALSRQTLEADESCVAGLPEARRKVQEDCDRAAQRQRELQTAWQAAFPDDLMPASPALASAHLCLVEADTRTRLAALDIPSLTKRRADFTGNITEANARIARNEEALHVNQVDQSVVETALNALPKDTPPNYFARFPELSAAASRTVDEWQTVIDTNLSEMHSTQANRKRLANEMGLPDTLIDLAATLAARDNQKRENDVKARAGEIVKRTRETITNKVMPLTLQNMQQLLPLLTDGRYHQVEWDAGENILSVYDQSARSMQRKRVFSGGARDQISLALRLAFALATLPGESHARPGWLFLDEPLSSFDRQRTQDLVDLLTRGMVRKNFAQVFLVSHSESFDPSLFDYRVKMSGGAVTESTLPSC